MYISARKQVKVNIQAQLQKLRLQDYWLKNWKMIHLWGQFTFIKLFSCYWDWWVKVKDLRFILRAILGVNFKVIPKSHTFLIKNNMLYFPALLQLVQRRAAQIFLFSGLFFGAPGSSLLLNVLPQQSRLLWRHLSQVAAPCAPLDTEPWPFPFLSSMAVSANKEASPGQPRHSYNIAGPRWGSGEYQEN